MQVLNQMKFSRLRKILTEAIVVLCFAALPSCSPESSTQLDKSSQEKLSKAKSHALVAEEILVAEKTRKAYQWYCAQCHGAKGHGDGVNAPYLVVPPRDHTKAAYLETRSDNQLFDAIKLGGLAVGRAPCMPAWGHTIDDKTIWSLVSYIRDLCDCEAL